MAEWCEGINLERIIGRREGNGPVKGLEVNPITGNWSKEAACGIGKENCKVSTNPEKCYRFSPVTDIMRFTI